MKSLYDRTDIYDLFHTEWHSKKIKEHWENVIKMKNITSLLDCSIGTGNLTLPLVELGIDLAGSDLSEKMLCACKEKAEQKGYKIPLKQSDFRELSTHFDESFDCVASTGNSLPHVKNEEVRKVFEQMNKLVKPGGYLYFDMRNWDKILREHERFYLYNPQFKEDVRINLIQVWDYPTEDSMTFNLLYTFERENRIFQTEIFEEQYYPIRRQYMLEKLKNMGYKNIEVGCHPSYFKDVDVERADWYYVLAEKGARL